jgi:hypothetical protein
MPNAANVFISSSKRKMGSFFKASFPKISKRLLIELLILLVAILSAALTFNYYRQGGKFQSSPPPLSTPPPTRPLPSGKQTYIYGSRNVAGPVPSEVTIDPLTPAVGATQTVTVKIKFTSPVTSAGVILNTDNKVTKFPLELTSGTTTDGIWKGTWAMPDSYDHIYYLQFDIKSNLGNYEHGLVFR